MGVSAVAARLQKFCNGILKKLSWQQCLEYTGSRQRCANLLFGESLFLLTPSSLRFLHLPSFPFLLLGPSLGGLLLRFLYISFTILLFLSEPLYSGITIICIIYKISDETVVYSLSTVVYSLSRVGYLFFTSYGLARSTACRSVSMLQVGGQFTHHPLKSAPLLEKGEVDL